jgi:hypothetical protein
VILAVADLFTLPLVANPSTAVSSIAGGLPNDRAMKVRRKPQEPIECRNPAEARMSRRL